MWQVDYSITDLAQALLTLRPFSIVVFRATSPDLYLWEFWLASGRHVIVVLSASQSRLMEHSIVSTSEIQPKLAITFGEALRLFDPVD